MWLHRAELNAMLTGELQKIAGCEGSTLIAGALLSVADFEHSTPRVAGWTFLSFTGWP